MSRNTSTFAWALACCMLATQAFAQSKPEAPADESDAAEGDNDSGSDEPEAEGAGGEATAAAAVDAGGSADKKFLLGLRVGYALPLGLIAKSAGENKNEEFALSDVVSGQIPIWLDAGYLLTPRLMLGAYGAYGFGMVSGDICQTRVSCSAHDIRFGIQGQYHFSPYESFNPWLGLGIGYEILTAHFENDVGTAQATYRGFEFATLQAGVDFRAAESVGIGPFVNLSFGEYTTAGTSQDDKTYNIDKKALHEWLTFGVRGAFRL